MYKTADILNTIICGDARAELKEIESDSIDTCTTSPPYWGLRDYSIDPVIWGGDDEKCEHKWGDDIENISEQWKHSTEHNRVGDYDNPRKEGCLEKIMSSSNYCSLCGAWKGSLGLEPHPSMYIDHIVEIYRQVRRVLKPTGSCWINLGDKYIDRQLQLLPTRIAERLKNDLNFTLINAVIWHKPNPMPCGDKKKLNPSYEYLFHFVKQRKYYYDLDAIREPHKANTIERCKFPVNIYGNPEERRPNISNLHKQVDLNPAGKNPGDVFTLSTEAFPGTHFATYPTKLIEKPILATCPKEICEQCGFIRERITKTNYVDTGGKGMEKYGDNVPDDGSNPGPQGMKYGRANAIHTTIGFTTCTCPNPKYSAGIVLDIFMGAGTTGVVARRLGRNYIGIELNPAYITMAENRIRDYYKSTHKPRVTKDEKQREMFR